MEPQIIAAHVIMGGIVLTAVVDLLRVLKKSEGDTRGDDGAEERLVVSYLTLRRVVGALGFLLPIMLLVLGSLIHQRWEALDSISDYYYLRTRDVFVGVLFVFAWFLFAYKGYEPADDRAGDWAWLFALGVAFFPTGHAGWQGVVHPWSAAGLFLVLAYFSLFLFTKSDVKPADQKARKRKRNFVYKLCGVAMLVFIATIALSYLLLNEDYRRDTNLVFWMEAAALWAFGISWFVKGETLWKDTA